jgi:hypothetical protein
VRTAIEMKYRFLLANLEESMLKRRDGYIDVTLCNDELENYLRSLGYDVKYIRYEFNTHNEWGYWGRDTGDGAIMTRISWE